MKKEVGGLLSIIFSLSLVSAQQLTDTIDSFVQEIGIQSLLLVVIFLVLFAVIFYSLKKVFPDTKSVPAIIAAAIGLISAYGIVQMDIGLEGYYYDLTDYLAISGGIVLGILPIALLVTMLVFWPYLPIILIGIGVLFVILSYFAYASAFVMTAGIFFIGLGIVSWFAIRAMLNPDNKLGGTLKTLGMVILGTLIILVGISFGGSLGALLGGLFVGLAITKRFGVIGAGILGFAAVFCGFIIAGWGGAVVVLLLVVLILMGKSGLKDAYGVTKSGWNQATFNGGDFKKKEIILEQEKETRNAQAFKANQERLQEQKQKEENKRHQEEQNVRAAVHQKQLQEEIEREKRSNELKQKEIARVNITNEMQQLKTAHYRIEGEFGEIKYQRDEQLKRGLPTTSLDNALHEKRKEAAQIEKLYDDLGKKLNSL